MTTIDMSSRLPVPLRYCVIGAGAVGGLYGGMLARGGREVHFLLHGDYDHVRSHGLRVDSVRGDFFLPGAALHLHASPESLPPCDVTLVALKTTRNHLLGELLPRPTGGGGVVLCLQNGLQSEADCEAVVGSARVLGGCCFLCSNKVGPGHICHLDYGRIVIGEFTPADQPPAGVTARLQSIVNDLQDVGIDAHATDDLWLARWRKLMWNIPFNGLSVVLNASTADLIHDSDATALAEAMMREVEQAAAAAGRHLPEESIEVTLQHTRQMVPYDSSMRLDFLAGREMELEAIFAAPIRVAESFGVTMPRVRMLHQQLRFLEAKSRQAKD